ncbi:MAG: hypothetical protein OHK0053_33570 [Microscillaceae bacterium]
MYSFKFFVVAFWAAPLGYTFAQIPVEVLVGHRQVQHEFFFFKDVNARQRFSLFSMGRFAVDYASAPANSSFISSQLTYSISPKWGLTGGGQFANGLFSPLAALSFVHTNEKGDFFLNHFPTYYLGEAASWEMFGLLFYTPAIGLKWQIFSQLIFGSNFNTRFTQHQFSYQQLRLGLGYRQWFQAGIGLDLSQAGNSENLSNQHNLGLFLRKEF